MSNAESNSLRDLVNQAKVVVAAKRPLTPSDIKLAEGLMALQEKIKIGEIIDVEIPAKPSPDFKSSDE